MGFNNDHDQHELGHNPSQYGHALYIYMYVYTYTHVTYFVERHLLSIGP